MDWANQFLAIIGWQSVFALIIGACVWPLATSFGRHSSLLVVLLWSIVLLRLVMPPGLASDYSLRSMAEWALSSESPVEVSTVFDAPVLKSMSSEGIVTEPLDTQSGIYWLFWVWLAGFLGCIAFFAYLRHPYRLFVKMAKSVTCQNTLDIVDGFRSSLGIKRNVSLRSTATTIPFTIGFARPVVIIPDELLNQENRSVLKCILAHEMHHVRHWDALWLYVQQALQCIYFFNPMVWYANASIHRARECLRDTQVLQSGHVSAMSYGKALLYFSTAAGRGNMVHRSYPAFAASDNQLKRRIEYMVKQKDTKMKNTVAFLAVCLIAFVLIPLAPTTTQAAADTPIFIKDAGYFSPIKEGRITSSFGKRMNPFTKKLQQHKGVDVGAPTGTPVFAIADGTVIESIMHEGYGNLIKVRHAENCESWYGQLHDRNVEKGDTVSKGQTIATVGSTGRSTAPHLHFEFRIDGNPVDPEVHIPLYHLPKSKKADDDC